MPPPARVVIPIESQDPAAWSCALDYARVIGGHAQLGARDYVLLTHSKHQLKSTSLARHLGAAVTKSLLANARLSIQSGDHLRHATLRTLDGSGHGAVIIAYYADMGMLDTLDGIPDVTGIVAVPELPGDIDDWIARWNPSVHGQQKGARPPLISDPVVEKALTALSNMVNLSHAVMNPRDKSHADETMRILRAAGHTLEPENIKSWAIRVGWKPNAADELARLASRIGGMKTKPSLASFRNPAGKYENWS